MRGILVVVLLIGFTWSAKARTPIEAELVHADGQKESINLLVSNGFWGTRLNVYDIQFRIRYIDKNGERQRLFANQISALNFTHKGQKYNMISIRNPTSGGNSRVLAQALTEGYMRKIKVYERQSNGMYMGPNGMMMSGGSTISPVIFLMKGERDFFRIAKWGFAKNMSQFVSEYSLLSEKIREKQLRFDDLEFIIKNYNEWYEENH